jgi:hypothetical protein
MKAERESILWNMGTAKKDEALLNYLVKKMVVGDEAHYSMCVHTILQKVRTKTWQSIYVNKAFIHSIKFADELKSQVEIGFSLYVQALELLYYCIAESQDGYNSRAPFDIKFRVVFHHIYGWKLPPDTANMVRILRNNVMHTGTISGIDINDSITAYFKKYAPQPNQRTEVQDCISLIAAFDYIMNDILMRVLGLKQENHLNRNGAPAWMSPYFGYIHGVTSIRKL